MSAQPEDDWEFTFVGDLKKNDVVRTHGKVTKVEKGTLTYTIYFENENEPHYSSRTWHPFHSVAVKKES